MASGDVTSISEYFTLAAADVPISATGLVDAPASPVNPRAQSYNQQPAAKLLLLDAIRSGRCEILQWCFSAESVTTMGDTLAQFLRELAEKAVDCDRVEILDVMLSSQVFDEFDANDQEEILTEMIRTSLEAANPATIDVLMAHGASLSFTEPDGEDGRQCPFAMCADVDFNQAITSDCVDIAQALVEQGVDRTTARLGTALHSAVRDADLDVVTNLLRVAWLDVDFKDETGRSALMMVASQGQLELGSYRDHPAEITRLLIENGADVNLRDVWGFTPLHHACNSELADVVNTLLEKGADPHAQSQFGCPHDQIYVGDVGFEAIAAILDLLLEYGADLHTRNEPSGSMYDKLTKSATGRAFISARQVAITATPKKQD